MTGQRHWRDLDVAGEIYGALWLWNRQMGAGKVLFGPEVVVIPEQTIKPDVVWVHKDRLDTLLNHSNGKVHGIPNLIVEIDSPELDIREALDAARLQWYQQQGVQEYWVFDRIDYQFEVYRPEQGVLTLCKVYADQDVLTSPILPGFACPIAALFDTAWELGTTTDTAPAVQERP